MKFKISKSIICILTAMCLSIGFSAVAFASPNLEAGSTTLNVASKAYEQKVKKAKVRVIKGINKSLKKYKSSESQSFKNFAEKIKKQIRKAKNISKIKERKHRFYTKLKPVAKFHTYKTNFIHQSKASYYLYENNFYPNDKYNFFHMFDKMEKALKQKQLDDMVFERDLYIARAQLSVNIYCEDWARDKVDYVSEWGGRNNVFLDGTPMSGIGYMIADAAYDTDMDPRIFSSIASIESGCGIAPYGSPYNVCGWICGTPAMYSWEDGVYKWHWYFCDYFGGERYPISSMHGYCSYGPWYVNSIMEQI